MIKITFHGAARTVTGSRHVIESNDWRILLDCGLYQGRRQDFYERNLKFPFDPSKIDTLIVSHAHIDHIGNFPNLVKQGFKGDAHCTMATADLAGIMLLDTAHIQENDAAYVTKVRRKHNQPPVEPLYRAVDVPPALELMEGHSYNRSFQTVPGAKVIFRDAGHILGSAITVLDILDGSRQVKVCYTGDLGRKSLPIIRDPFIVDDADILITESTYGNRLHSSIKMAEEKLARVVNETVSRKGKIIVPSFALERTQELVYTLHQLRLKKIIPEFPIYVDSPLATDATDIFRLHPECFDEETNEFMRVVEDPFGFRHLHYVHSADESRSLNLIEGPVMIIAGSGMAESGRVLHHLKNNIADSRNTVLIVGWQAENTLGRKIAEKREEVPIFGEFYPLRSQVEVFDEFSAHADRNDLLEWVKKGKGRWQKIFIVHGDEDSSLALADTFRQAGLNNIFVPQPGQSFDI
jgi:metallo-beta-lactamase family protein